MLACLAYLSHGRFSKMKSPTKPENLKSGLYERVHQEY